MTDPNDKLDFSAISFDDIVGDGAPGLDIAEEPTQEVEKEEPNELDEDAQEYDRGDEDADDDNYEQGEEETYVEDSNEEHEEEDLLIADQISNILGYELENEYDDRVRT
jgi:hypothetical protein